MNDLPPRWLVARRLLAALCALVLFAVAADASAQERCPYSVTSTLAAGAPLMQGRLKNGAASVCGAQKTVPVIQNAAGTFRYATYALENRSRAPSCVTLTLTATAGIVQSAAYLGAFDPNNPQTGYLADSGANANASTVTYGVTVPALATFTVVVNATNGTAAAYTLGASGCGAVVVTAVAPNAGFTAGGTDVTVSGSGFLAAPTVLFRNVPATNIVLVDPQTITATTPPGTAGAADVTVTNADATASTLPAAFTYNPPAATNVTLASNANPAEIGQIVTFTANVGSAAGQPSGKVSFLDGTSGLGDIALDDAGRAALDVSTLAIGSHAISARYGGTAAFAPGTSTTLQEVVVGQATSIAVSSSQTPSVLGASITLMASVTSVNGASLPRGSVTFMDGDVSIGDATLDATGGAQLTTNALFLGAHPITVTYPGDKTHAASTSMPFDQEVGITLDDAGASDAGAATGDASDTGDGAALDADADAGDGGDSGVPLYDYIVVADGGGGCSCRAATGAESAPFAILGSIGVLAFVKRRRRKRI